MMTRRRGALVVAIGLLVSACSSGSDAATRSAESSAPTNAPVVTEPADDEPPASEPLVTDAPITTEHSVVWGEPATSEVLHLNNRGCPGDVDLGPNEKFLSMVGRAYPRVAPGRIDTFVSDFETEAFEMSGVDAPAGQQLVVWTPTDAESVDAIGTGLTGIVANPVDGGFLVTATTDGGAYTLELS